MIGRRRIVPAAMLGLATVVSLLMPGALHAWPVLNELFYDAVGPDAEGAFTEIFGSAGMELTGWTLAGINGADGTVYRSVSLTGAVIPADGLLVVATSQAVGDLLDVRDFIGNVDWQNGPDAVRLMDPSGIIADAIQYGDAGPFNAGEGQYAVDVDAGFSLSRDGFGTDTDDNSMDLRVLDVPTPGIHLPVSEPVPEPGTMLTVGLGMLGLGSTGRRFLKRG